MLRLGQSRRQRRPRSAGSRWGQRGDRHDETHGVGCGDGRDARGAGGRQRSGADLAGRAGRRHRDDAGQIHPARGGVWRIAVRLASDGRGAIGAGSPGPGGRQGAHVPDRVGVAAPIDSGPRHTAILPPGAVRWIPTFGESQYDWRPMDGVRSVREVLGLAAEAHMFPTAWGFEAPSAAAEGFGPARGPVPWPRPPC